MSIDWSSVAIVFATLMGPVFAVQVQRIVQKRGDEHQRQLWIFRSLMNTRAGTLSVEHVNALNAVQLEFHKDKVIMRKWRTYLDHLNNQAPVTEVWGSKRIELYNDLLAEMAKKLGYEFDPLQIKNELYAPRGHFELENDQQLIRRGVVALLTGQTALPLDVKSIAQDPEMTKRIAALQDALAAWFRGELAPRVRLDGSRDGVDPLS